MHQYGLIKLLASICTFHIKTQSLPDDTCMTSIIGELQLESGALEAV